MIWKISASLSWHGWTAAKQVPESGKIDSRATRYSDLVVSLPRSDGLQSVPSRSTPLRVSKDSKIELDFLPYGRRHDIRVQAVPVPAINLYWTGPYFSTNSNADSQWLEQKSQMAVHSFIDPLVREGQRHFQ